MKDWLQKRIDEIKSGKRLAYNQEALDHKHPDRVWWLEDKR